MTTPTLAPAGVSPFDRIRRTGPTGEEFWSARDLLVLLGYTRWENFTEAVERAQAACQNSGFDAADHLRGATKMIGAGKGASRSVLDYHLTRFGAYLVAMNGDPRKAEIADAQAYFAVRTHQAERLEAALPALAPMSPAQQALLAAQALVDLEHRTAALEAHTATLERRLDESPVMGQRKGTIHRLGQEFGQAVGNYGRAWRLFNDHFGLGSYKDLPDRCFDEACRFLELQISAYTGRERLLEQAP